MLSNIEGLLFDLDGTLTDYEASRDAGLLSSYEFIRSAPFSFEEFRTAYDQVILEESSHTSQKGIQLPAFENRVNRFRGLAKILNWDATSWLNGMAESYGIGRAKGATLFPGVTEALHFLASKYRLGLITEGSVETQTAQIQRHGLTRFFKTVIISGATRYHKPDLQLYQYALEKIGLQTERIVMVGDRIDWDIIPAKRLGMKTILFNSDKSLRISKMDQMYVDAVVHSHSELIELFKGITGNRACH